MDQKISKYSYTGNNISVKAIGTEEFINHQILDLTERLIQLDKSIEGNSQVQSLEVVESEFNFAEKMQEFENKSAKIRFLAIGTLLHLQGFERISSADIKQQVQNYKLTPFANVSDCRAKCIKEGLIATDGKRFYVTQSGSKYVGISLH